MYINIIYKNTFVLLCMVLNYSLLLCCFKTSSTNCWQTTPAWLSILSRIFLYEIMALFIVISLLNTKNPSLNNDGTSNMTKPHFYFLHVL